MQRILLFILLFIFVYNVHAQMHTALEVGYTYSTARILVNDAKQKSGYRNGFTSDLLFDIPFEGKLHFSPSLGYHLTGYQAFYDSGNIKHTENNIHFFSISAGLTLNYPSGNKNIFIIGFSPVFSFPFSGKEKSTWRNDSVSNDKLIFAFGNYGLFDLGVKGTIGFKMKKMIFEVGWFEGLTNLDTSETGRNIQDRIFSFTIGYFFK